MESTPLPAEQVVRRLSGGGNCLFIIDKQFFTRSCCIISRDFSLLKLDFRPLKRRPEWGYEDDFGVSCHVKLFYICRVLLECDVARLSSELHHNKTFTLRIENFSLPPRFVQWIVNAIMCRIKSERIRAMMKRWEKIAWRVSSGGKRTRLRNWWREPSRGGEAKLSSQTISAGDCVR